MHQGDCETCGKWDSNLLLGMCSGCAEVYNLSIDEMKSMEGEIDEEREHNDDPLLQC